MAAPIRFVSGPRVTKDLDANRRRTGAERIVMLVEVGSSSAAREVDVTERDLLDLISRSAEVLDLIRRRREEGMPLPGSGEVVDQRDVGRIPGDL